MQRKEKKSSPPIWLGRRAPYYIYYQKAGWVFHMLRMLMIDLDTYNEDTFKAMIQDFYKSYQGSTVTTEDFKNIVEKHIKTDMAWFFAQWIYGSEIPKLSFDYSISQKKDGNYLATCKFQQDNVSEDFISHIPIEIDFGNNQKVRRRILVKGNERIMEISLPQKPEKIVFNILDSVLSE
jgi:aminopeptidase N